MKQLTIEHNHGICVLENAELFKTTGGERTYQYAKGVCVGGGETSRLFGHTKHTPFETGVEMMYPCYRAPWCEDEAKDHWRANIVTCG